MSLSGVDDYMDTNFECEIYAWKAELVDKYYSTSL